MRVMVQWVGTVLLLTVAALPASALAEQKSFQSYIKGLEPKPGFINLYVDPGDGRVLASLPWPDEAGISIRFIYAAGLTAGLGSNPIGLDRGASSGGAILRFRKIGNRIIAEQENWRYRATADRPSERRSVEKSFATSFLWQTPILAQEDSENVLIDLSGFLTRDPLDIAQALKRDGDGSAYTRDAERSFPDPRHIYAFPDNIELDAYVTFKAAEPNAQTKATAADAASVTLIQHHSLVRLPDEGYSPRRFDHRTGVFAVEYYDFSAPLEAPINGAWAERFRLEKVRPGDANSPVKRPIVFYVDPGAPKDIRDALIEGASWWRDGFAAAGFENAYRVETLPEDAHPLDVRYNVINWVHRQTRGWSYGGNVSDPRTGEVLKANVILGSQRVRQDRMIFEGLSGVPAKDDKGVTTPRAIALARIRQLAAHEVGHTLGFGHNFAASSNDHASVMDYPAPYVRPKADGTLDFSQAYGTGLGAWDLFTVKWLYGDVPEGQDERAYLGTLIEEAYASGLRFINDAHARAVGTAHPYAAVWDNGNNPIAMLEETMAVRAIALENFGLDRIAEGRPRMDLAEVIVPIYLYHRYQLAAAAKLVGGIDFQYSVRGDNAPPAQPVNADTQRKALTAILATLEPKALDLPDNVLNLLSPGDIGSAGYVGAPETFPKRTGQVFDLLSAADALSQLTLNALCHPDRLERLIAFSQRRADALSADEALGAISAQLFKTTKNKTQRQAFLMQTAQARYITILTELAGRPQTSFLLKAAVEQTLTDVRSGLAERESASDKALVRAIERYFDGDPPALSSKAEVPQGSPIGTAPAHALRDGHRASGALFETCWHCEGTDGG